LSRVADLRVRPLTCTGNQAGWWADAPHHSQVCRHSKAASIPARNI